MVDELQNVMEDFWRQWGNKSEWNSPPFNWSPCKSPTRQGPQILWNGSNDQDEERNEQAYKKLVVNVASGNNWFVSMMEYEVFCHVEVPPQQFLP